MSASLYVGTILYGYCEGYFGRGSYGDKRIEAIGADWVVVREEAGDPVFASARNGENIHDLLSEHTKSGEF